MQQAYNTAIRSKVFPIGFKHRVRDALHKPVLFREQVAMFLNLLMKGVLNVTTTKL